MHAISLSRIRAIRESAYVARANITIFRLILKFAVYAWCMPSSRFISPWCMVSCRLETANMYSVSGERTSVQVLWFVPGCKNRSNKVQCKGIKFYTLPKTKEILQTWLSLIGRRLTEISLHSRICSQHFLDGIRKDSVPQIFPWQNDRPQ